MSATLDDLDDEFNEALLAYTTTGAVDDGDELWTDEDQARYDAEAAAYFAALDYGYDNVMAKPTPPIELPLARVLKRPLWARVRAWLRGKDRA